MQAFCIRKSRTLHMAKNYLNRYVWLIDTIFRNKHISLPEISRQWQRSSLN